MGPHHLKLVETTIQFLQFMTSIFIIILSASGATFYYYWTNKLNGLQVKNLWPFVLPTGIVFGAFIFIGVIYSMLIDALSEGTISKYVDFWFKYVGIVLWLAIFISVSLLGLAFILVSRKVQK